MPENTPPCPGFLTLAQAAVAPLTREEVLGHAASCDVCRAILADLARLHPLPPLPGEAFEEARRVLKTSLSVPVSRRWIPWAAAAALLGAVGLPWRWLSEGETPGGTVSRQEKPQVLLPCPPQWDMARSLQAGSGESLSLPIGRASALVLKPGSRAEMGRPGELSLLHGALWVENPGEALGFRVGEAWIRTEGGTLLLEIPEPASGAASLWLAPAWAEAPPAARLFVMAGSAQVGFGAGLAVEVKGGQALLLEASRTPALFSERELAWRGDGGWERLPGLPRRLEGGEHPLGPPSLPESYAWEAVIRRSTRSAAAGVTFVAAGQGWQMPLGGALGEDTPWLRVRLELRGGWVRLMVGASEVVREPVGGLKHKMDPARPFVGLRSWGGALEVQEVRWQALR